MLNRVFAAVLGLVLFAAGLVLATLTSRTQPHSDREMFAWMGVSVFGAFMVSPDLMTDTAKKVGAAIKPLLPWGQDKSGPSV